MPRFLLALLALVIAMPVHAQESSRDRQVAAWTQQAESIRGLKFKQPVKVEWRDRDALVAYLENLFDKEYPPAEIKADEALLKHLSLIPADASLRKLTLDMLGEGVAGFYNPEDSTLWIIDDEGGSSEQDSMTVVHELIHALEDQHFDLLKRDKAVKHHDDKMLALTGLVEGSATYGMFQPMLAGTQDPRQIRVALRGLSVLLDVSGNLTGMDAPDFMLANLIYPYAQGLRFVTAISQRKGYAAVNAAYDAVPESTEQILHPEKYLGPERDVPFERTLPDLAKTLGEGWSTVRENTMGELQIRLAFDSWLISSTADWLLGGQDAMARGLGRTALQWASKLAPQLNPVELAAGWGGDRYQLLAKADGTTALVWCSLWDTDQDAEAFVRGYRMAAKAREVAQPTIEVTGRNVIICEGVPAEQLEAVMKAVRVD